MTVNNSIDRDHERGPRVKFQGQSRNTIKPQHDFMSYNLSLWFIKAASCSICENWHMNIQHFAWKRSKQKGNDHLDLDTLLPPSPLCHLTHKLLTWYQGKTPQGAVNSAFNEGQSHRSMPSVPILEQFFQNNAIVKRLKKNVIDYNDMIK